MSAASGSGGLVPVWGGDTDRGLLREGNEDAFYASGRLFVVADGLGGHEGGAEASLLAVETVAKAEPSTAAELCAAVHLANDTVFRRGGLILNRMGMGTTLVAICADRAADGWHLVNCGDSRAYRLRDSELAQLTVDHGVVSEAVAEGRLTAEEARYHPDRNQLSRAIGIDPETEIDDWALGVEAGDRYLLCTDGITNELADDEIAEIMAREQHPSTAARDLVNAANDRGGSDNSTAVVVDFHDRRETSDGDHSR